MGPIKKKDDEDGGGNPYMNIEKTFLLQEARTFNETPVNPRKCTHILTKILYLLNQGEILSSTEATEAFFAMTKLFQSRDVILRRMVYLGIKELSSIADDVIIVTSSLTKDMTGKEDLYRAAAIRALCSITDVTMLQGIERYMKQAIVDRNSAVSSAALVSSLHLTKIANDVIKRMANEAQEALISDSVMVQYHALGVLYHIRKSDRLAVTKLAQKLTRISLKSPYAVCMVIRIICKLIDEEEMISHPHESPLFEFIESSLRHKSEMVIYEAAQGIVNLKRTTHREIGPAISVLQLFCASAKATLRFGAARTLNKIAMIHPTAIGVCNIDLENLITDSNRSIATLAITTLLKTGTESSVDRLMKQISTFVSEISDEFKVVVVQAIKALCFKFPRKHLVLMSFLSGMLRDEGGLEYKASIADTIIIIIEENPDAKEIGLAHLCEFIEDCEHTLLAVRILHLLGKEGPRTKTPSGYIRFIYNRVILECASVRAAAVAALAQFGAACPDLRDNICVLLSRCQMDSDDEVRDRATYYTSILQHGDKKIINDYIISNQEMSIPALERALRDYLEKPNVQPFDLNSVPLAPVITASESVASGILQPSIDEAPLLQEKLFTREDKYIEKLSSIPELQSLGPLFHSSDIVGLTESETEYTVRCIKHTYAQHLVLQFDCQNTLSDQLLERVHVQLEPPDGFAIVNGIPIEKLPYNEISSIYVVLRYPDKIQNSIGVFGATLKFVVKDCDPTTGVPDSDEGYADEYMLEDIDLTLADQIDKRTTDFEYAWEDETKNYIELQETFELSQFTTLDQAVKSLIKFLGFRPHNKSEKVPEGKTTHAICLSGTYRGNLEALAKCKLALAEGGITMQLTLRCMDQDLAELIMSTVG